MADDINKKITVDVQVNTDAQKQLDQYRTSFDNLRTSINNLGKPLSDLSRNIRSLDRDISKFNGNMSKLNSQNKDVTETGSKLKGVFEGLGSAFSGWKDIVKGSLADFVNWGAALSQGLSLLADYGPQIVSWVTSLIKGQEAIDKTKLSVDTLNNALEDSNYVTAIEQFDELKINVDLAKKGFLDKTAVVNEYNDTLGRTMGKVSDLNGVEAKLIKNGDAYVKMTLYKAAAQLALQDAAKKTYEAEQARLKSDDESLTFWDKVEDVMSRNAGAAGEGAPGIPDAGKKADINKAKKAEKRRKELTDEATAKSDAFFNIAKDFQARAAKLAKDSGFDFFSGQSSPTANKGDNNKLKEGLSEVEKIRFDSLIKQLQSTNSIYAQQALDENQNYTEQKQRLDKLLKDKLISLSQYHKEIEKLENEHSSAVGGIIDKYIREDAAKTLETHEQLAELEVRGTKKIDMQLQTAKLDLVKQTDIQLTKITTDGENKRGKIIKDNAKSIADTALSLITKNIQAQSDAKVRALEKDKANELNNKNLTAAQKQAVEAKYQKKENDVKVKAFKAQQKTSIAQAIINGAIAITKSESELGPIAGTIAIAGIIANTALQVATIAKQKPPAMAKGGYFKSDGRGAVLSGYSRSDDTNAYLRSGEAVVVSEAMRDPWARNLVSAINVAYGGRDFSLPSVSKGYAVGGIFSDGGNANRYYNQPVNDQKNLANTVAYQMINNFPPVYVDVKDVNNQQNILAQTINRVNL